MSKRLSLSMITAIAVLGFASPVLAQGRTSVSAADMDAAVAARPAPRADLVRALLSGEQAQKVAALMGVSAADLATRVAALDATTLEQLAQQSGVADSNQAGGADSIVISTTAIIIILLILILLSS